MPLTVANLSATITASLMSSGLVGQEVPKLAMGVARGLVPWAKALQIVTVDAGTAGVGSGVMVWAVPSPLLVSNLLAMYPVNSHIGTMAASEASGLGNGMALGFVQGLIRTRHPTVGTGTGVARILPLPAFPYLMQGFASVKINGVSAAKKANAISQALAMTLAVFTLPVVIVGSVSPSGASGVGTGRIV